MSDYIVRATAAGAQIRAFAATTKGLVEAGRCAHNTSPVVSAGLGRLMTGGVMMGAMLKGENAFSYAPYTEMQAREFIHALRQLADYIIIDCTSNITNDILSAVSLIESDAVLRLVSCDLKSISYLNSQLPLLLDNKFNANKQYKAASNVSSFQADDEIEQIVGGVNFKIPHSDEVYKQFLAGNLFGGLTEKDSKDFRKAVSKIANEVFYLC